MSFGIQIAAARKAKNMTQPELAERIGVSREAVSEWEQDQSVPTPDCRRKLEEILGLFLYDEDRSMRDPRFFDEDHMSSYLKGKLMPQEYPETLRALSFAQEKHRGAYRKPYEARIPYINHPLTMACHALAMGIEEDTLLAALLLHDVVEDCDVTVDELPVSEEIRRIVALVTKPPRPFSLEEYYGRILSNSKACLVKCIDRCNNLSSMSMGFTDVKIVKYVAETERYYPNLLIKVKACPEYNRAAWLLSYQIKSLVAMAGRIG